MSNLKFKDVQVGETKKLYALLVKVEERETKTKSKYLNLFLSDGDSVVGAKMWDTKACDFKLPEKSLIEVVVIARSYGGSLSFEVKCYKPAPESMDISEFIKVAPIPSDIMYADIVKISNENIGDDGYRDIVLYLLEENKDKLMYWSAAKQVHHNIYGGLLYHIYRMLKVATGSILCVYPTINKDLLLSGLILHDIGKIEELTTDELGSAEYSAEGTLLGHALLGIEMIERANRDMGTCLSSEKLMLLKHMIASHHGKLEYGAIALPSIPEAMLLNHIDMIDASMYQYEDIQKDLHAGELSCRVFGLGCKVYKSL